MGSLPDLPNLTVDSAAPLPPFRVLVVGGSYGGLSAALNLQDLCSGLAPRCGPPPKDDDRPTATANDRPRIAIEVTIVDERDGFYHLIGSPLALADETYAAKAWVRYDDVPALQGPNSNIRILHGTIRSVDPASRTATYIPRGMGTETAPLTYDFLVAASGLRRVWPVVPQSLRRKQYLFETASHIRAATMGRRGAVIIVGGGAVGIEMAAELKLVAPHLHVTLVHSRAQLLSSELLPDEVKSTSLALLRDAGVEVLLSHRVSHIADLDASASGKQVTFSDGTTRVADAVISAVSRSAPTTGYLPGSAVDDEGYVRISANLIFPAGTEENHFAVGDLVRWSGIKRCGTAMHMGYMAASNIYRRMRQRLGHNTEGEEDLQLDEIPPMIGLAVGTKAVAYWPEAGTTSGEDVMKAFFGDDLGFTICWNHLGLGKKKV